MNLLELGQGAIFEVSVENRVLRERAGHREADEVVQGDLVEAQSFVRVLDLLAHRKDTGCVGRRVEGQLRRLLQGCHHARSNNFADTLELLGGGSTRELCSRNCNCSRHDGSRSSRVCQISSRHTTTNTGAFASGRTSL